MTDHEKNAWFNFWVEIGKRMGLKAIPPTKTEYDAFVQGYETEHFVYADDNRRVADATVKVMENWMPAFIRPGVKPIVYCLMSEGFLKAVGYPSPPAWRRRLVQRLLKLVGRANRFIPLGGYPRLVINRKERTYPKGYNIEEIQPVHLSKHEEKLAAVEAGKRTGSTAGG